MSRKLNLICSYKPFYYYSLYPLHQSWRLFNELHRYDISSARWTHIAPASDLKPPAMAGHSATVHSR